MKQILLSFISITLALNSIASHVVDSLWIAPAAPITGQNITLYAAITLSTNFSIPTKTVTMQSDTVMVQFNCYIGQLPAFHSDTDSIVINSLSPGLYTIMFLVHPCYYSVPLDTFDCNNTEYDTAWLTFIVTDPSAIDDVNNDGVRLFPNPTTNTLQLHCTTELLNEKVTVIDALGREVYNTVLRAKSFALNTSHWVSGIYIVRVGNTVKRIIKE